jgi:hypothetical protein
MGIGKTLLVVNEHEGWEAPAFMYLTYLLDVRTWKFVNY